MSVEFRSVTPRVDVLSGAMGWTVYGINHEMVTERGVVPLRLFVSAHTFMWRVKRSARRWLAVRS